MWTASRLAEVFGPRVQVRAVDLVCSGSSGWLALEARPGFFETVTVARALRRRGVPLAEGKPAVEALLLDGHARVHAEHIDDALEGELLACKVRMTVLPAEAAAAAE
jgi:hypothetical protein